MHDCIHDCIRDWHPVLDPEVGSRLEYEYSVTQLLPGNYIYVKWWDGGPVFASYSVKANCDLKHGFLGAERRRSTCFRSPVFLGQDGPTVSRFFAPP